MKPLIHRGAGLGVALVILLTGCAGYRLGPVAGFPAGSKSVRVNLFENRTWEPRLSEAVAHALRKRLQQDSTYRLVTQGTADVAIAGTLTGYERFAVSFQPGDTLTPRDFDVILRAQVTAEETATGKKLIDREIRGRTTIRSGANLAGAERQSLPILAEDLARNIAELLVDGTW